MDVNEEFTRIAAESTATLEPYVRRCIENLYRVGRLVGTSVREGNEDILRSAVVFLHATLEDCLRSIVGAFLPTANETILDRVPLIGMSGFQPQKFLLGKLAPHCKKTVGEVIKLSVEEYLRRMTFNNASQIAEYLQPLGFEMSPLAGYFPTLEAMMKRRHQIVHRADQKDEGDVEPIDKTQVFEWAETVSKFLSHVLAQAGNKDAFVRIEQLLVKIAQERRKEL